MAMPHRQFSQIRRKTLQTMFFSGFLCFTTTIPAQNSPILVPVAWTNGQFQFGLLGETHVPYILEGSTDLQSWISVATNGESSATRSISLSAPDTTTFYRAIIAMPLFGRAIAAIRNVVLSSGDVDSFDSTDPLHSTAGLYDPRTHKDGGIIETSSTNAGAISIGSTKVYGVVGTGFGGSVALGSGIVGDSLFVNDPSHAGTIQSGHSKELPRIDLPTLTIPNPDDSWIVPTAGSYNGSDYTFKLDTGNYILPRISIAAGSSMVIAGNAVLYVPGPISISGSGYVSIAPAGSLRIYCGAPSGSNVSATISGGGFINLSGLAKNLAIFGLPTCTNVLVSATSSFIGVIYAPQADLRIAGSPSAVGAVAAKTVSLVGGLSFHYDERLGSIGLYCPWSRVP